MPPSPSVRACPHSRRFSGAALFAALAVLGAAPIGRTQPAPASLPAAAKIFFVIDPAGEHRPIDDSIKKHLEDGGFAVTLAGPDAPAPSPSDYQLVLISGTIHRHSIDGRYRDSPIPLITWQPGILEDLRMTGRVQDTDYGNDLKRTGALYLYVVNAPHPLAAGIPNGILDCFTDTQKTVSWGRPGLGATIIATMPGELRKATIFAYERGALMDGDFAAPARRVMLFLNPTTFKDLSSEGLRLFDAAITWSLASPTP